MKSFLLHIYQREQSRNNSVKEREIVGVVEGIESEKQTAFSNPEELWEILTGKPQAGYLIEKSSEAMISRNKKKGGMKND